MTAVKFTLHINTADGHAVSASYEGGAGIDYAGITAEVSKLLGLAGDFDKGGASSPVLASAASTPVQPTASVGDAASKDGFSYATQNQDAPVAAPTPIDQTQPLMNQPAPSSLPMSSPPVPDMTATQMPVDILQQAQPPMQQAQPPMQQAQPPMQQAQPPMQQMAPAQLTQEGPAPVGDPAPAAAQEHLRSPIDEQWEKTVLDQAQTLLGHPSGAAYLDNAIGQVIPGVPSLSSIAEQNRAGHMRKFIPSDKLPAMSSSVDSAIRSLGM